MRSGTALGRSRTALKLWKCSGTFSNCSGMIKDRSGELWKRSGTLKNRSGMLREQFSDRSETLRKRAGSIQEALERSRNALGHLGALWTTWDDVERSQMLIFLAQCKNNRCTRSKRRDKGLRLKPPRFRVIIIQVKSRRLRLCSGQGTARGA